MIDEKTQKTYYEKRLHVLKLLSIRDELKDKLARLQDDLTTARRDLDDACQAIWRELGDPGE